MIIIPHDINLIKSRIKKINFNFRIMPKWEIKPAQAEILTPVILLN